MKKLNNKGYLLVEIVVAFVLAIAIAYFIGNITVSLKNKEQDLNYNVNFNADKALITKEVMDDVNKYSVANITKADSCGVDNGIDYSGNYTCIDMLFENGVVKRLRIFNGEGYEKKIVDDKQVYDITYGVYDSKNNVWDNGIYIYENNFDENLRLGKLDVVSTEHDGYHVLRIKMSATTIYSDSDYGINIVIPYVESEVKNYSVYNQKIWVGSTATLQQAVDISKNGYIIKPLKNISAEPNVSINKNVIIDTDGKTINMEGNMTVDAEVTINGGGIIKDNNSGNLIEVSSDKKLYLEKIIIEAKTTGIKNNGGLLEIREDAEITANTYGVNNLEDGIVNMLGGSISTDGDDGAGIYNASIGNITVSGTSKISTSGEYSDALLNNSTGIIEIKDDSSLSTTGEHSSGIYLLGSGTIIVSGGSISSEKTAAVADISLEGKIYIRGGKITSENASGISFGNYNDGQDNGEGPYPVVLEISGGTIIGKTFGVFNENGQVYVSGGNISAFGNGGVPDVVDVVSYGNGLCNCGITGETVITGGTIVAEGEDAYAVFNRWGGTLIIGDDDGTVSTTTPDIKSKSGYGVRDGWDEVYANAGTFKWYDGVISGTAGYLYNYKDPIMPSGYSPFIQNLDGGVQSAYLVK